MSATDSMSLRSRSRTVVVALNVITTAFVAHFLTEFLHEVTHGITSLFTGQRWDTLYLQASSSSWLDDGPHLWGDVATLVSAPLFNIVCALVCVYLFPCLSERPSTRLFVLLFGG